MLKESRLPAPTAQVGSIYCQVAGCLAVDSEKQRGPYLLECKELQPQTKITAEWALLTDPCLSQALPEGTGSITYRQRDVTAILMARGLLFGLTWLRKINHKSIAGASHIGLERQQQTKAYGRGT